MEFWIFWKKIQLYRAVLPESDPHALPGAEVPQYGGYPIDRKRANTSSISLVSASASVTMSVVSVSTSSTSMSASASKISLSSIITRPKRLRLPVSAAAFSLLHKPPCLAHCPLARHDKRFQPSSPPLSPAQHWILLRGRRDCGSFISHFDICHRNDVATDCFWNADSIHVISLYNIRYLSKAG